MKPQRTIRRRIAAEHLVREIVRRRMPSDMMRLEAGVTMGLQQYLQDLVDKASENAVASNRNFVNGDDVREARVTVDQ